MTAATQSPAMPAPQPGAGAFPYEDPVDPASVGVDPRRLAAVAERFRRQHADGAFPGGQLVARRRGKVVLSVVIGVARGARPGDGEAPLQVEARTPFPVYSAGKPVAAIALAILESRGLLDVTAPIARVVPEFARSAHAGVTTLEVLTHTAGLVVPAVQRNVEQWGDRKAMLRLLLESRSLFRRGTFAYMPFEYGWVLSELVERIDGRPLPDFMAQEIAGPLGLPALAYGFAGRDPGAVARSYWLGKDREMVAGMNVADRFEELNNARAFFECRNPAYTMISDAATLAAWYEALVAGGVAPDGAACG